MHKNDLQHHIVEHFELEDVDPDDLKLKVAESAIHSVDVDKLKYYEESLQDLKTKLTKSSGKVKSAVVSQIANTRENAKTLFEAFQENIKIAESFDHEFEEHEESMKNLARSKLNSAPPTETGKLDDIKFTIDISYPEEVEEAGHEDVESIESRHYESFWAKQEAHGNYKYDGEHSNIDSRQWISS